MRNGTKLTLLTCLSVLLGPIGAFGGGYFNDLQCTNEEQNLGECNRTSDGINSLLLYLSNASYGLTAFSVLMFLIFIVINISCRSETIHLHDCKSNDSWIDRKRFNVKCSECHF